MMELLAPAGGYEALTAAVQNGADAVSMRSAPSVTTTWVLSDFTLEVMEPAPMWDL